MRISHLLTPFLCLIALGLIGCNPPTPEGSPDKPGQVSGATSSTKLKIGISIPSADHGWTAGVIYWAKQAQELYPDVEWTLATAESPEKQIKDLETMMVKKLDGIVVLATASAPITPVAEQIHNAGILLVNVDRGFLKPVADVFIEGDNKAFGKKSAEYIAQKLGGKGNIVILEGIPCTVNTDRVQSALEVFKQYPDIKVVAQQSGEWNSQKSLSVMQTILLKNPKIDAVWASDDDMALGAEKAIKEAGREKEMWILGGAGMKDIVKRVMDKDPMYPADITYPPSMIAVGIQQAVSILRNGNREKVMAFMPRHMMIDVEMITPENAERFYFPNSLF